MSIAAEKLITAIGEKAAEYKRLSCKDILDLCEAYRCIVVPVHKVKGGDKDGIKGKVYKSKVKAERKGRAIKAAQNRRKGDG